MNFEPINIKHVKLSQIKVNEDNPRSITEDKFNKLINSILSFPRMLEIRPIVVDKNWKALGGNMRYLALVEISKMDRDTVMSRIGKIRNVKKKKASSREDLGKYWQEWLANPVAPVIHESDLEEEERKQFVIADNGSFGQWDYDVLGNKWNADDLNDWGVDVWRTNEVDNVFNDPKPAEQPKQDLSPEAAEILSNEQDEDTPVDFGDALPPELQGMDLNPNNLPKIQGTDETLLDRIIIVFPKDRKPDLLTLLGMSEINKIVYRLEEIIGEAASVELNPEKEEEG